LTDPGRHPFHPPTHLTGPQPLRHQAAHRFGPRGSSGPRFPTV